MKPITRPLLALLVPVATLTASAADKAGCKDPAWAPQRLPGYEITDCKEKVWTPQHFEARGGKDVAGHRSTVEYELVDESKNATNDAARNFYAEVGKKSGATLMSPPNEGWAAVLTQKTAQGEFWYSYRHGSGNDKSTGSYTLTTLRVEPPVQEVQVTDAPTLLEASGKACKDPGWLVKQFAAFKLDTCEVKDFDTVLLHLPEGRKPVAGRVMDDVYVLTDESQNPVPQAVWKNYVTALQGIGAKLLTKPDDQNNAVLYRKTAQGEYWYVYKHGSGNEESTSSYSLLTVMAGGPPPRKCVLTVYGVNFDFDKATLRPDSMPVLDQVLALFTTDAAYAAQIGGHTDNQGTHDHNQKLSAQRADAVKQWLASKGVAAARMTTAGYGDSHPLVPNDSDENKAKNRRVELRRANCKD